MTRQTQTKSMRVFFGAKENRVYPPLPMEKKLCKVCMNEMLVADGSVASFHGCCRPYRKNSFGAYGHIEECHNPKAQVEVLGKLLELNKQDGNK